MYQGDALLPRKQIKKITQDPGHRGTITYRPAEERASFIWFTSFLKAKSLTYTFPPPRLEFQIPYLHFLLPIKKGLKGNVRQLVRAHNLQSSQTDGPLSEAPTETQSLPLIIGSGGDRRQGRRLFRVHSH